jgi:hypothetical protein
VALGVLLFGPRYRRGALENMRDYSRVCSYEDDSMATMALEAAESHMDRLLCDVEQVAAIQDVPLMDVLRIAVRAGRRNRAAGRVNTACAIEAVVDRWIVPGERFYGHLSDDEVDSLVAEELA